MAETNRSEIWCNMCGGEEMEDGDDGFYYCRNCGARLEGFIDTGVADEDFVDKAGAGSTLYLASHKRKTVAHSHNPTPFSLHLKSDDDDHHCDAVGPTGPADFGSGSKGFVAREEDYCTVVRRRYVVGVQTMFNLQCEALIDKFKVTPLICDIASSIWLRFVGTTKVYDDGWADKAVIHSENQGEKKFEGRKRYEGEPRNLYNQRLVLVWCKSLKQTIPLSCSLAVVYLACHVAREPILPTDIVRWIIEGKIPYLSAFNEIEERMEKLPESVRDINIDVQFPHRPSKRMSVSIAKPSIACPLSARYMFRPSQAIALQKLESMAASIAESVGLSLPSVNFNAIASRYLKQLRLPLGKILPHACRVFEWSMPPELWLSANDARLPTRVCVMSILIVTIRILYNINGHGKWEESLSVRDGSSSSTDNHASSSHPTCESHAKDDVKEGSSSHGMDEKLEEILASVHELESEATELLQNLDKRYNEMNDRKEYSKDLPTYLQYCRDVVFAGSCEGDEKEAELIEKLWDYYQKNLEDIEYVPNQERARDDDEILNTPMEGINFGDRETISSSKNDMPQSSQPNQTPATTGQGEDRSNKHENLREIAIRQLEVDMEEHRFFYIPPRVNVKRHDYLVYARKRNGGSLIYAAHADYYIILRACAKVAQVDVRAMHTGVLTLERRIDWIEKKIDSSLQQLCGNKDDPDISGSYEARESANLSDQNA